MYARVAHRRAVAASASAAASSGAAVETALRNVLDRVGNAASGSSSGASASASASAGDDERVRPLEDPHLVGEEAASRARTARLARESGDDILLTEDRRWDWFLGEFLFPCSLLSHTLCPLPAPLPPNPPKPGVIIYTRSSGTLLRGRPGSFEILFFLSLERREQGEKRQKTEESLTTFPLSPPRRSPDEGPRGARPQLGQLPQGVGKPKSSEVRALHRAPLIRREGPKKKGVRRLGPGYRCLGFEPVAESRQCNLAVKSDTPLNRTLNNVLTGMEAPRESHASIYHERISTCRYRRYPKSDT